MWDYLARRQLLTVLATPSVLMRLPGTSELFSGFAHQPPGSLISLPHPRHERFIGTQVLGLGSDLDKWLHFHGVPSGGTILTTYGLENHS